MAAFVAQSGKYTGYSFDYIKQIDPDYLMRFKRRTNQTGYHVFTEWLMTQPRPERHMIATGKHKGKSYDEVWRRYPRYILKIYDRKKGPLYDNAIEWFQIRFPDIQKKRLKYASGGEELAIAFFRKHNIHFLFEFSLPSLPNKRLDFMFEHGPNKYILEIDGIQHFQLTKYFHRSLAKFKKYRQNDITKSLAVLKEGYRLIRIDFSELPRLDAHLIHAIRSNVKVYFTDALKYEYIIGHLPY